MKEIDKLRKEINDIDKKLIILLNSRANIAYKIGKAKNRIKNNNIFRPERQAQIIKKLSNVKGNKLSLNEIFFLWKSIFYLQTRIQGKQNYVMPIFLKNKYIEEIKNFFGYDLKIKFKSSIKESIDAIKNKENRLLFLKYPSTGNYSNWWMLRELEGIYVIASLPLILKSRKKPLLLILSNNKPILEGENQYLYISNDIFLKKELKLLDKRKGRYLYISKNLVIDKKLKFLGAYPSNLSSKKP